MSGGLRLRRRQERPIDVWGPRPAGTHRVVLADRRQWDDGHRGGRHRRVLDASHGQ